MRILAVDDEPHALRFLKSVLERDHEVITAADGAAALERIGAQRFDLVLTDLRMPPPDGLEILRAASRCSPPPPVILLTAVNTARAAVEALGLGACDFLVKPAEPEEILAAIHRVMGAEAGEAKEELKSFGLVGSSAPIRLVRRLVPTLAARRETVLVLGETGTGKDLLARVLHDLGPRRGGPFVAHNMAATPAELAESVFFGHVRGAFSGATADHAGLFEQAHGGTLFLDEVDSFPLPLQAKLLRVLECGLVQRVGSSTDRAIDTRVIASSARDPDDLVGSGLFRADLYYRLRQLEVVLPPLRQRPEDVPALIAQALAELAGPAGRPPRLAAETLDLLLGYPWPGNVRELRYALASAVVIAGDRVILPGHLPRALLRGEPDGAAVARSLRDVERRHILETLAIVEGNRSRAARMLGIDRGTLARKLGDFPAAPGPDRETKGAG